MALGVLVIVFLILLNGVLAMTELAMMYSRKNRLLAKAETGNRGAIIALELKANPSKFLSTVQIGITLIGILSGAFGGVTIAESLGVYLSSISFIGKHGEEVSIFLVVTLVTYVSLVIGELVPKQIALKYADEVAIAIATPIHWLSRIAKPLVLMLDMSNKFVLFLLGIKTGDTAITSAGDITAVIDEGVVSGALEPEERMILKRVMRLDDIRVSSVMTPRRDVVWIEIDESTTSVLEKINTSRHSRYPICKGNIENVQGVLEVKEYLLRISENRTINMQSCLRQTISLTNSTSIFATLERFKKSTSKMALILDEYGGLEGIVTLKNVMEAIVGVLPEPAYHKDYTGARCDDGTWLLDGGLSIQETEELLNIKGMVAKSDTFNTLSGFLVAKFGVIPQKGDQVTWKHLSFRVLDMDGNRVGKIRASIQTH